MITRKGNLAKGDTYIINGTTGTQEMHKKGRSSPFQKGTLQILVGTLDNWKFTRRDVRSGCGTYIVIPKRHTSYPTCRIKGHWIIGNSQEGMFWPWDTIPKKDTSNPTGTLVWDAIVNCHRDTRDKPSGEIAFQPRDTILFRTKIKTHFGTVPLAPSPSKSAHALPAG